MPGAHRRRKGRTRKVRLRTQTVNDLALERRSRCMSTNVADFDARLGQALWIKLWTGMRIELGLARVTVALQSKFTKSFNRLFVGEITFGIFGHCRDTTSIAVQKAVSGTVQFASRIRPSAGGGLSICQYAAAISSRLGCTVPPPAGVPSAAAHKVGRHTNGGHIQRAAGLSRPEGTAAKPPFSAHLNAAASALTSGQVGYARPPSQDNPRRTRPHLHAT